MAFIKNDLIILLSTTTSETFSFTSFFLSLCDGKSGTSGRKTATTNCTLTV